MLFIISKGYRIINRHRQDIVNIFPSKCNLSSSFLNRLPLQVSGQLNIRHKYHLYIDRAFSLQVSQRPASTLKEKADTLLF
jgi:hypothetical protein